VLRQDLFQLMPTSLLTEPEVLRLVPSPYEALDIPVPIVLLSRQEASKNTGQRHEYTF
jgi:homoserine trans-succinylase